MVGGGEVGFVAEFLFDGECFVVPVLGAVVVPPGLGEHAELVVGAGEAGFVTELLEDGE